jgi:hypothetical protein
LGIDLALTLSITLTPFRGVFGGDQMNHSESRRLTFLTLIAVGLAQVALGCSDDNHGPTIGTPTVPVVIVDGGGSGPTSGGGAAGGVSTGGTPGVGGSISAAGFDAGGGVVGIAGDPFGAAGTSPNFGAGGTSPNFGAAGTSPNFGAAGTFAASGGSSF